MRDINLQAFAAHLRREYDAWASRVDGNQERFGREVAKRMRVEKISQGSVSAWLAGKQTPGTDAVFAMERLLAVPPGALSRHMGYLPLSAVEVQTVAEAIAVDPDLTAESRIVLTAAWQAACAAARSTSRSQ
jgi:transcriptional regulator with XRE-family HTH domain